MSHKVLIDYDLDTRIGNIIPVGGEAIVRSMKYNDLGVDAPGGVIVVAAVGSIPLCPSNFPIRRVLILADVGNAGNVLVGGRNPQFPLLPGAGLTLVIDDLSKVSYNTAIGNIIYWIAEAF